MKLLSSSKPWFRPLIGLPMVAAALLAASIGLASGADAKPDKTSKTEKKEKTEKKSEKKTEKKAKLTGQELYAIHCSRCHAERYPTEFTANQWKTVLTEMRVRANLPATDAKAILKYLQEDSGTP
jgi:mono/diheme cytochrome c family protein